MCVVILSVSIVVQWNLGYSCDLLIVLLGNSGPQGN